MEIFKKIVEEQLSKPVFMPANKDPATIRCTLRSNVKIEGLDEPSAEGYLIRRTSQQGE